MTVPSEEEKLRLHKSAARVHADNKINERFMIQGPVLSSLCTGAGGDHICLSTVYSAEFIPSLIAYMSLYIPNSFIPGLKCTESFRPEDDRRQ